MTLTDTRSDERRDADSIRTDAPSGAAPARRSGPSSAPRPLVDSILAKELIAVVALTSFTIATAAGYARVFAGWQFLDDFIVIAVVGHGLSFAMRRIRIPALLALPILAAALAWLIGYVAYRDTYSMLLPTGDTLELFRSELDLVRQQFRTAVAPVIFSGGWDVIAAIGIAMSVVLSDTFAFRAYARAEALVPGGVLFVFIAALGTDRDRVDLTAVLVATGVVATCALRALHAPNRPTAIGRHRSPTRAIVPGALVTALLVAGTAGFVGQRLPGADSEPIYETRGGNSGSVTNIVSPLVDIRSRLTNRSDSELFVVAATSKSYWRVSALPRFDGTTWGLPERLLTSADGELSVARPRSNELRQEIRIVNLGAEFIPAAADPIAASPTADLRWNADSATLLKTDGELTPGDTYQVVSASPRFTVEELLGAGSTDAGDPIYLELPSNLPVSVGQLAAEVTAGAGTSYEAALGLQNWFRAEFEYNLDVQAGHSSNAIEGFLRDRVGYCEQFAGTYAAMMRTLGIPARVAVGFTPGNFDGEAYSVLGKNAHAWPEVWFDGLGWVPFEPTPGRGLPGAENYTNVAAQQDDTGVDPSAPEPRPVPGEAPTPVTTLPPTDPNDPSDPGLPGNLEQTTESTADAAPAPTGGSFPWTALYVGLLGVVLLAGPALVRAWRRRRAPDDPAGVVAQLWRRATDAVAELGITTRPSMTPAEQAALVAHSFPVAARPLGELAEALTTVTYGPDHGAALLERGAHGRTRLAECHHWCRQIERAVNESVSPLARIRRYFTRLG